MDLIRVTWVDYTPKYDEDEDPTVRICGRSADGERIVRYVEGCRPHCYVPTEIDPVLIEDIDVLGVENGHEMYNGQPVKKVTLKHPKQVNTLKESDAVEWTAEADIPFYRRATWDYGLSGYIRVPDRTRCQIEEIETDIAVEDVDSITPRVVVGDIEVVPDGEKTFDEMRDAVEEPIVACSLHDSHTEEFVLAVVDPEGDAEGSAIKAEMIAHWDGHDLYEKYVDDADINYLQCESEVDLINSVIGKIQQWRPDLLSGWNWIDFDHHYLTERAKKLDDVDEHKLSDLGHVGGRSTETAIKGLPGFDQMAAYDDKVVISESRSLALEYIASEELGIGKIDAVDVAASYEHNRARLAAYNLLDVQLCVAITAKHSIEEFYLDLGDLTGVQVYDVFYEKRLVDGWIASRKRNDQVLPNQADRSIDQPAGGLVLAPSQGVEEDVAVFDFKSLYPSSTITCNISPETMIATVGEVDRDLDVVTIPGMPEKEEDVGGTITPENINWTRSSKAMPWSMRPKQFSLNRQGILAEANEGPFHERERYKVLRDEYGPDDDYYVVYDRKQGAVKVVHNSMYGVMNSPYYRLARNGIGDAITGVSRYVLWRTARKAEEIGYEVVYGDTDSILVKMPGDRPLKKKLLDAKGLVSQLNSHVREIADDLGLPEDHPFVDPEAMPHDLPDDANHLWALEFEKFYGSFIQCGKKKRYAGRLDWKEGKEVNEVDITGFESQRADVPRATEEVQTEVIEMVLAGAEFGEVSAYVRGKIEEIREQADLTEIGIPKSINKPLDDYPNRERVRAARHSNRFLDREYGPGDTPWMFYVSRTPFGVEGTDVIAIDWNDEIPDGYEVDEEKTIVKAFESALKPIIGELDWTFSEIRAGKQAQAAEEETGFDGDPFAETSEGSDDEWEGAEAW